MSSLQKILQFGSLLPSAIDIFLENVVRVDGIICNENSKKIAKCNERKRNANYANTTRGILGSHSRNSAGRIDTDIVCLGGWFVDATVE